MQFDMLRSLVVARHPYLDEAYFTSCCIKGLQEEIRSTVKSFWPSSVEEVFSIATLKEYLLSFEAKHNSSMASSITKLQPCVEEQATLAIAEVSDVIAADQVENALVEVTGTLEQSLGHKLSFFVPNDAGPIDMEEDHAELQQVSCVATNLIGNRENACAVEDAGVNIYENANNVFTTDVLPCNTDLLIDPVIQLGASIHNASAMVAVSDESAKEGYVPDDAVTLVRPSDRVELVKFQIANMGMFGRYLAMAATEAESHKAKSEVSVHNKFPSQCVPMRAPEIIGFSESADSYFLVSSGWPPPTMVLDCMYNLHRKDYMAVPNQIMDSKQFHAIIISYIGSALVHFGLNYPKIAGSLESFALALQYAWPGHCCLSRFYNTIRDKGGTPSSVSIHVTDGRGRVKGMFPMMLQITPYISSFMEPQRSSNCVVVYTAILVWNAAKLLQGYKFDSLDATLLSMVYIHAHAFSLWWLAVWGCQFWSITVPDFGIGAFKQVLENVNMLLTVAVAEVYSANLLVLGIFGGRALVGSLLLFHHNIQAKLLGANAGANILMDALVPPVFSVDAKGVNVFSIAVMPTGLHLVQISTLHSMADILCIIVSDNNGKTMTGLIGKLEFSVEGVVHHQLVFYTKNLHVCYQLLDLSKISFSPPQGRVMYASIRAPDVSRIPEVKVG